MTKILILTNIGGPDDIDCYTKKEMKLLSGIISSLGYKVSILDMKNKKVQGTITKIEKLKPDLVFNLCEEIYGSSEAEPLMPQLFELLNIDYIGCNSATLHLTCDKTRVKEILSFHNIPTVKFQVFDLFKNKKIELRKGLRFPLFLKPSYGGGSVGIDEDSIVFTKKELDRKIKSVSKKMKKPVLVEEFLPGREFTAVVIGNEIRDKKPIVFPIMEIKFDKSFNSKNRFCFYDTKWSDRLCDKVVKKNPEISKELRKKIEKLALDAYTALDCNDFARVDIRLDKKSNPFVMDINSNPGLMASEMKTAAKFRGITFEKLIKMIIDSAIERCRLRKEM